MRKGSCVSKFGKAANDLCFCAYQHSGERILGGRWQRNLLGFVQAHHFSNVFVQRTFVVAVNACSHLHNKICVVLWSALPWWQEGRDQTCLRRVFGELGAGKHAA